MTGNNVRKLILLLASVLLVVALACSSDGETVAAPAAAPAAAPTLEPRTTTEVQVTSKQYDAPPAMTIDPNKTYTATFVLEKGGEFVIDLAAKEAPITVNNFVFLAREGYYDGITFHRVIADFMAQGGDPTGTGSGGPGYKFDNETSPNLRHDGPGVISMANAGMQAGRGTNGSQFFITLVATPALDGYDSSGREKNCSAAGVSCHTVFGKVSSGMDVVNGITVRDPGTARTEGDVITTIRIDES